MEKCFPKSCSYTNLTVSESTWVKIICRFQVAGNVSEYLHLQEVKDEVPISGRYSYWVFSLNNFEDFGGILFLSPYNSKPYHYIQYTV